MWTSTRSQELDAGVGVNYYQKTRVLQQRRPSHKLEGAVEVEAALPPVSDEQLAEHYPAIAAAAALPQPSLLRAMKYIELSLGVTFCACLIFSAAFFCWAVLGGDSLSHWPVTHTLLLCVALPIALIYIAIALVTAILAWVPHLQAHVAFAHRVKHLPAISSAGHFDPAAGLLPLLSVQDTCAQPRHAGLPYARPVRISTSGGIKLGAWHVLPAGDVALDASARIADGSSTDATFDALLNAAANASEESASGPVAAIYLHGMGEARRKWTAVERAKLLSSHLGLHVLLIDYRGFGDSDGYPDEEGLNADAAAALTWLTDRGVKPQDVIVWGHSLGTGPAVQLASSQEVRDQPLRGLILEAPYTSMVDAATTQPPNFLIRTQPFGTFIIRRYFIIKGPSTPTTYP